MFLIKFEGESSNYFKQGETYVGRTCKQGDKFIFNDKGYWSRLSSKVVSMIDFDYHYFKQFKYEKVFYVNNHKEALSYPQIAKVNWGVDFRRLLDGEEFIFFRQDLMNEGVDLNYDCRFCNDGNVIASWIDPKTSKLMKSDLYSIFGYGASNNFIINRIKKGSWIITQKENV
jgi:hypothetical protein